MPKKILYVENVAVLIDSVEYDVVYDNFIDLGDLKGKGETKIDFTMVNKSVVPVNVE